MNYVTHRNDAGALWSSGQLEETDRSSSPTQFAAAWVFVALVLWIVLAFAQLAGAQAAPPVGATVNAPAVMFPTAGVSGGSVTATQLLLPDGSATAPGLAFTAETNSGIRRPGAATMGISFGGTANGVLFGATNVNVGSNGQFGFASGTDPSATAADTSLNRGGAAGRVTMLGGTPMLQLGGTTSSFPALKQNGAGLDVRLADDSAYARLTFNNAIVTNYIAPASGNVSIVYSAAPTLGTCAGFGTSPAMSTTNGAPAFLVTLGTAPPAGGTCTINLPTATTGWICNGSFRTSTATMRETSTTTTTAVMTVTGTPTASEVAQLSCFAY